MASATSSLTLPLPKPLNPTASRPVNARPPSTSTSTSRRDFLLFTATTTFLTAVILPPAYAKDIPLFGLRKKIEKVEKEAEELVKEGFETAEKGLETAEKEVVDVEKEIESAAEAGNGLAQAGIVAAAEVFGLLVATSIVNGILAPEPKSS